MVREQPVQRPWGTEDSLFRNQKPSGSREPRVSGGDKDRSVTFRLYSLNDMDNQRRLSDRKERAHLRFRKPRLTRSVGSVLSGEAMPGAIWTMGVAGQSGDKIAMMVWVGEKFGVWSQQDLSVSRVQNRKKAIDPQTRVLLLARGHAVLVKTILSVTNMAPMGGDCLSVPLTIFPCEGGERPEC